MDFIRFSLKKCYDFHLTNYINKIIIYEINQFSYTIDNFLRIKGRENMKKFMVVLFSALLAVSMTACGGSQNTTPESSVTSQVSSESTVSNDESSSKEESENSTVNSQVSSESSAPDTSDDISGTTSETSSSTSTQTSETSSTSSSIQTSSGSSSGSSSQTSGGSSSGSSSQTSGGSSSGSSSQTSGGSFSGSSGQTSGGSSSGSSGQTSGGSSSGSSGQTSGGSSSGSSSQPSESSSSGTETSQVGPLLQKCFIDVVSDGKFYMDATVDGTSNGQTLKNTPMVVAADSKNQKVYMSTKSYGMSIIVLSDGKNSYILYPSTKTAVKVSEVSTGDVTESFDTDDMFLTDTGSETFNGKKCQYETYYADGVTSTYYFYNNTLSGIVMQSDETDKTSSDYINVVVIINELSNNVDDSLFTVPSDYTISDSTSTSFS